MEDAVKGLSWPLEKSPLAASVSVGVGGAPSVGKLVVVAPFVEVAAGLVVAVAVRVADVEPWCEWPSLTHLPFVLSHFPDVHPTSLVHEPPLATGERQVLEPQKADLHCVEAVQAAPNGREDDDAHLALKQRPLKQP